NQLAACSGEAPILVLAHSAGGVLVSFAADRLEVDVEPGAGAPRVTVVTVASPLAGVDRASHRAAWFTDKPFAIELGGRLAQYPAPLPGVHFVHVRTHPSGDAVMQPTPTGHRPDDPRAVVPGAVELALPPDVGHDEALLRVAERLRRSPAPRDWL
ncbi:MAG: hypothetical protein JNK82_25505, partial [Myxococcaceae bacterium]|nr:hypothetical protein [Myxococcaceae bacterium]